MNHNDIPCRVSADIRRHQAAQNRRELEAPEFDYFDDAQMKDLCGEYLWESLQGLLSMQFELAHQKPEEVKAELAGRLKTLERALRLKFREDY